MRAGRRDDSPDRPQGDSDQALAGSLVEQVRVGRVPRQFHAVAGLAPVGGQEALAAQSASKVFGLKSRLFPLTVGVPKSPLMSATLRNETVPPGLEKSP